MKLTAQPLLVLSLILTACGGGGVASDSAGGDAGGAGAHIEDGVDAEHHLTVKVDGTRYEARGHPFGPTIHYAAHEVNVQVGGPLTSAVAAGENVRLGDFDLIANLLANDIEPGEYSMLRSSTAVRRSEDRLGFAEFFFPKSAPFKHLRPVSGTITLDSVQGREEGKRYRLERAKGQIEGTFVDKSGAEHRVEGTFDYVR